MAFIDIFYIFMASIKVFFYNERRLLRDIL